MGDKRQQLQYMGDRCAVCEKSVEDILARHGTFKRVFQFHHTNPETKHPDYDNLIRRQLSTEQLDELDKCVLLCSFCHDLVESQNIDATVRVRVNLNGRTAEQTFRGQVIWDKIANHVKFVTHDRFRLASWRVQLGMEMPHMEFESELEANLVEYLRALEQHKVVKLGLWPSGPVLLLAEYVPDGSMRMEYDIRCPLISAELEGETNVWTRNGCGLTDRGEVIGDGYTVTIEGPIPI